MEFKGTRTECFEWLEKQGFVLRGTQGWVKPGTALYAIVLHERQRHGDFFGEVRDWEGPNFIALVKE